MESLHILPDFYGTKKKKKNAVDNEVTFYTRLSSRERSSSRKRVRSERSEGGREGRGARGQFCYTESKSQQLLLLACVVFLCVEGGPCPFELFRRRDNGWMLRTYVERPLRLTDEELHAGPAV